MLCVILWLFVFFFKQKTAYEMRISDWSSDVCSSDLTLPARAARSVDRGAGIVARSDDRHQQRARFCRCAGIAHRELDASRMTWRATVLTLYPAMFPGPLGLSLAGRAREEGRWALDTVQIRDFATDKHRTVDDTPAGGGAGMVLRADVVAAALDSVVDTRPVLAMTPRGAPLTQGREIGRAHV